MNLNISEICADIWLVAGVGMVYLTLLIGAIGSFLPIIPGPLMGFLGILVFKLCVPSIDLSWWTVAIFAVLAGVAQLVDLLFSWVGAKKFGATWKGALGAILGAIVGISAQAD